MTENAFLRIPCPHCGSRLRIKASAAGTRVVCPNKACGQSFLASAETESAATPRPSATKSRPRNLRPMPWAAVSLGAGLLLIAVTAGVALVVGSRKDAEAETKAGKSGLTAAETKAPPAPKEDSSGPKLVPPSPPIPNRAPTIEVVQVEPAQPIVGKDLSIRLKSRGADGASTAIRYRIRPAEQWEAISDALVRIRPSKAGALVVQFQAVDGAGVASAILERRWEVQEVRYPPLVAVVGVSPPYPNQEGSLTVHLGGADPQGQPVVFQYRMDRGDDWQDVEGDNLVLDRLQAGIQSVQVRARSVGGIASEPISHVFFVDPVAVTRGPVRQFKGHKSCAHALAFTPDGMSLLSGSCDGKLLLWRTHTDDPPIEFKGVAGAVFALDISRDGRFAISGGRGVAKNAAIAKGKNFADLENDLQVWDLEANKELGRLQGHHPIVNCVRFSPDGKQAASGDSRGRVCIWDVAARKKVRTIEVGNSVQSVAFSPDGKKLLSGGGTTLKGGLENDCAVRAWDVETGKEIVAASGHTHRVTSVAFLADPRYAISSSGRIYVGEAKLAVDPFVRIWDLKTGKEVRHFVGSDDGVASLTVTLDKKYVFCASGDGNMRLRDLESGNEIHRYEGHSKKVLCVAITRNSHYVATGSEDGRLFLWDLPRTVHIPAEMLRGLTADPPSRQDPNPSRR